MYKSFDNWKMEQIILKDRKVTGGIVQGEALVSKQGISFYGGVDCQTGIITERRHELHGKSVKEKILVFPFGKGSAGWARGLFYLVKCGTAPKALVTKELCEYVVIGAVATKIPTICDLNEDPTELIQNGNHVEVNADKGIVKVIKRAY